MIFFYRVICLTLLLYNFNAFAQQKQDSVVSCWKSKNKIELNITQNNYVNWNSGGINNLSLLSVVNFQRVYTKDRFLWSSELNIRYGINQREGEKLRKSDDQFQLESGLNFSNDTITRWSYAAKGSLITQLSNGFNYPNTDQAISRPFAPAYFFIAY